MPRITVLMPTYNVAPWVKESIDSVLAQTYTDFELLVLDDCSTDNTVEIVRSYGDPRIRIVEGEHNVGLSENLNRGISLSNTELLARMDGDDIAEPTWLERGVAVLDSHPDVGICSFGFKFFGNKSSLVRFPESHEDSMVQMLFGCTVIIPVLRRSVFVDNGLWYSTDAFPAEDYMMWAHCYRKTKVYNVQETMFHYRTHATQISTSKRQSQIQKSNEVRLFMLDWLNEEIGETERKFFIDRFVPCEVSNKEEVKELKTFAEYLIRMNSAGHFSNDALRKKFDFHISYGTLAFVEAHYFEKGYNLFSFVKMLCSGLYVELPSKHRMKLFAKSILFKRKKTK